jgi:hypothetical protein
VSKIFELFTLIGSTICFEAPLRKDLERSPRLAARRDSCHLLFLGFCGYIKDSDRMETPVGDD